MVHFTKALKEQYSVQMNPLSGSLMLRSKLKFVQVVVDWKRAVSPAEKTPMWWLISGDHLAEGPVGKIAQVEVSHQECQKREGTGQGRS